MDFKLLGSILLIVGTCIGAGMLALPIVAAQLGFMGSVLLLVGCWFVMTVGSFLILEVSAWLPLNSNIISMAGATLGPLGQIIAWVAYLLLLYSLLCAYIAGGSDLFHNLLALQYISVSAVVSSIIFTAIFSIVVYLGIRFVDYVNRGLMFFKLGSYVILIILLMPLISLDNLSMTDPRYLTSAEIIMVTITAFGYATIVPSLRIYFAGDIRKLKKAILIGSLIPLICYIIWDAAIMGVIPFVGDQGLGAILHSNNSTSQLVNALSMHASQSAVTLFVKLFTSICVVTSFLGVSLCLMDFLADGLQLEKQGKNKLLLYTLTFIPSLIIVIYFPHIFIKALQYAGIYSIILLMLLPAAMAWRGRYIKHLKEDFQVPGGKPLLGLLLVFSVIMLIYGGYYSI